MTEVAAKAAVPAKAIKIAPGANTLREYETIYLLKQDMTTEQTDRIKERVRSVLEREGAKVLKFTTWGKKKTAFLVGNKQARAIFVHVNYLAAGGTVAELERNLRILKEEVLKFQTIKISDAVLPDSRQVEEDVVLEGDREEAPREEGREYGGREGGYGGREGGYGRDRGDRGGDRGDRGDRGGERSERPGSDAGSDDSDEQSDD